MGYDPHELNYEPKLGYIMSYDLGQGDMTAVTVVESSVERVAAEVAAKPRPSPPLSIPGARKLVV